MTSERVALRRAAPSPRTPVAPPGPRVVLADDAAAVRLLTRALVEEHGFEVVAEAVDGLEVVVYTVAHRPELLVLDAAMARLDVAATLGVLRRDCPQTAVVVYSKAPDAGLRAEWQAAGAVAVCDKDHPDALPGALRAALAASADA